MPPMDPVERGTQLRKRVEARGYSQADFAEETSLSERTIRNMYKGDKSVAEKSWRVAEEKIRLIEIEHTGSSKEPKDVTGQGGKVLPKEDGPYRVTIYSPDTGRAVITFDGGDPAEVERRAVQIYHEIYGDQKPADATEAASSRSDDSPTNQ